ncbi:MAG: glycosyltransferase [Pseudomonadota bacterium]
MLPMVFGLLFLLSLLGIALFFPVYPAVVWFLSRKRNLHAPLPAASPPFVSLVTVVREGENLMGPKIKNFLALDYPGDKLEFVIFEDGKSRELAGIVQQWSDQRVFFFGSADHRGKNVALNEAASQCRGEILVFSDADALLAPNALRELAGWFENPDIGGVCGRRVIAEPGGLPLESPQKSYLDFDASIRLAESKLGSITSNDGKLYAIRRDLFSEVPPAVTDDLYACLSVVRAGRRFIYTDRAVAFINLPSRGSRHELERRRRIVSRSLRGIYLLRELFNPLRFGAYSFQLFVNKVVRRLTPLFLIGFLVSSLALVGEFPGLGLIALLQVLFYGLALGYRLGGPRLAGVPLLGKISALIFYFTLGQLGTLLGLSDFLLGKKPVKWTPQKAK